MDEEDIREQMKILNRRVEKLEQKNNSLISFIQGLTTYFNAQNQEPLQTPPAEALPAQNITLSKLTTKQHAVLQMLLCGKSNQEISDRLGVTVNTVKVHVRGVARKYGCNTRSQVVMKSYNEFESTPDNQYKAISGGLPKEWATNYLDKPTKDDPYFNLYQVN